MPQSRVYWKKLAAAGRSCAPSHAAWPSRFSLSACEQRRSSQASVAPKRNHPLDLDRGGVIPGASDAGQGRGSLRCVREGRGDLRCADHTPVRQSRAFQTPSPASVRGARPRGPSGPWFGTNRDVCRNYGAKLHCERFAARQRLIPTLSDFHSQYGAAVAARSPSRALSLLAWLVSNEPMCVWARLRVADLAFGQGYDTEGIAILRAALTVAIDAGDALGFAAAAHTLTRAHAEPEPDWSWLATELGRRGWADQAESGLNIGAIPEPPELHVDIALGAALEVCVAALESPTEPPPFRPVQVLRRSSPARAVEILRTARLVEVSDGEAMPYLSTPGWVVDAYIEREGRRFALGCGSVVLPHVDAHVRTAAPARILAPDPKLWARFLDQEPMVRELDVVLRRDRLRQAVGRCRFLSSLQLDALEEALRAMKCYTVNGSTVIDRDQTDAGLFLVIAGRVRIVESSHGFTTARAALGTGETFGELGVLTGTSETNSIVADGRVELGHWDAPFVRALVARHPATRELLVHRAESKHRHVKVLDTGEIQLLEDA